MQVQIPVHIKEENNNTHCISESSYNDNTALHVGMLPCPDNRLVCHRECMMYTITIYIYK